MGVRRLMKCLSEVTMTLFSQSLSTGNDCSINIVHHNRRVQCLNNERIALLKFKAELIDDYGRLSTWRNDDEEVGNDCCRWRGVVCDNSTNNIVELHLQGSRSENSSLKGKIISESSLVELNNLRYLDLSDNDFSGSQISKSIFSLLNLQHLNLSGSKFGGLIPQHLGNLSKLRLIDLGRNWDLESNNLDWLSRFHSLEYLDLSGVNLNRTLAWLQTISNLKSLKSSYFSGCSLSETYTTFSSINAYSPSHLHNLDLSSNNFDGRILEALGHFKSLRILNLSYNNGNLTSTFNLSNGLRYIDFSWNNFDGRILEALGHLASHLSHIDLSYNNLEGDFPQSYMFLRNFTKLEYLDLSSNKFNGMLPNISRLSFIKELRLADNELNGLLIEGNLRLPHLEVLDVSGNQFSGNVPILTSCSSSLKKLNLGDNMFNGTLTVGSIRYLSKIEYLDLHSNQLKGIISESHLFNLSLLQTLMLSFNSNISIKISSSWKPPFQLDALFLSSCNLGPDFPKWLQTQKKLTRLFISNAKIQATVPDWFWDNSRMLESLGMSNNQIHGIVPDLSFMVKLSSLDLASNQFNGPFPLLPPNIFSIDLSNNRFSGTIDHICNDMDSLFFLNLSNNLLFGVLHKCHALISVALLYLNLENNNFSGGIPNSFDSICSLASLHLRNNSFEGEIPMSLRNCNQISILDLGENNLTGNIPDWIGESMPGLLLLGLNSNMFHGSMPFSLCNLTNLHVLDISSNKISGSIPKCIKNFSFMSMKLQNQSRSYLWAYEMQEAETSTLESAMLTWKGKEFMYDKSLGLVKLLDLSSNNFVGEVPLEITSLVGLIGLNLSRNNLVGPIPRDIGKLEYLNFLDLSQNNLSGGIPSTLSHLNQLGVLNMSFNNLSGRIPWINHLQSFGDSSFMGNPGLCGDPLQSRPCPKDLVPKETIVIEEGDDLNSYITQGFYVCTAIGFITSFCVVLGTIFHNRMCRIIFLEMITCAGNWLYVQILVRKNRLKGFLGLS